jgi:hypothetical protein
MTLYILDTDHLSLYGRNHPVLILAIEILEQKNIAADRCPNSSHKYRIDSKITID